MGKSGIALRAHIRSSKWYYTAGVGDIQSHPNRSAAYTIPNRKQYTPNAAPQRSHRASTDHIQYPSPITSGSCEGLICQ